MIDTHAHLASRFAQEVNLDKLDYVILSASSMEDSKDNLELVKDSPKLKAAIGIHPQEAGEIKKQIKFLENLCEKHPEIVAIGECGLEYLPGANKEAQSELFEDQIKLAQKYDKALIVHSREAAEETLSILKKYKNLRGVIHCYTGGKKRVNKYLEISPEWFFGIDGNLTYESGLEEVVKIIPKDRLVLETDSPFLAPVPHRGKTNKPEWIEFTYKKVAEIWGENFKTTEKRVDDNAKRLFKIV